MRCFLYHPVKFSFNSSLRAYNLKEPHHINEVERVKTATKIDGLTWAGTQRGSVYTGHYPVPFGAFTYMIEGSKYMATMSVNELADIFLDNDDSGKYEEDIDRKAPELFQDTQIVDRH